MTIMMYEQTTAIDTADRMKAAGMVADQIAAKHVFADYHSRKAQNTKEAQRFDLAVFVKYLSIVGVNADEEWLQNHPEAWQGVTWGLVQGFVKWQLDQGFAVGSINRRLSTVKTYAKLAAQAGSISAQDLALIRTVAGYGQKEAKRVNEGRTVARVGSKKADHTSITDEQAKVLKTQPDTPQGRRDAVLMALLLDHGLRAGEVAALTVTNIDLANGMLVNFYRPKVDKVQNNKLSAAALKALRSYFAAGDAPPLGQLLRGSRKGGKLDQVGMSETAISERVRTLGADLGIEGLSAHDCRHYWATYWGNRVEKLPKGVFSLQEAGGWNSLSMPRRYVERSSVANEGMA